MKLHNCYTTGAREMYSIFRQQGSMVEIAVVLLTLGF